MGNRFQARRCDPSAEARHSSQALPRRGGRAGQPHCATPLPQERSLQALQCLQQVRVRLRPPLQVAQQLCRRKELPVRADPGCVGAWG